MTRYSKTMGEALLEVRNPLIEDNVNLMRKASKGAMQTMKMKDGKVKMDSFTASAIMSIYDNVNSKNKNKIEDMITNGKIADLIKLQKFAMSKVSGSSRKSTPAFTGNSGIRAGYNEELEIEFDNMFVSEAESGNPDDQYDDEEERQVTEGKMKELHGYIKDGKTAEQIAKLMKLDVKTIKSLMAGYNEEVDLDEKVKEYKGVAYFKDRKDAEAHMKKFAPKGRIVEYERGYAIQVRTSGPYLNKSGKIDEEVDLDEIDMNMVAFATFGFGAMVVLPGIIALDMLNSHTDGGVDRTLEKIINGLKSKLKKDKNYKPSSTEIDASKKLEKQM